MSAPATATKLTLSGYCPAAVVKAGPLHLSVTANGQKLGTITISQGDQPFAATLALPESLHGAGPLTIQISVDRVTKLPGEPRKLGVIFGKFAID
jgi:hypothetical protein